MEQHELDLLVTEALDSLAQHRASLPKPGTPLPESVRALALQLRSSGMSIRQISHRLDVSPSCISSWIRPSKSSPKHEKQKPEVVVYPINSRSSEHQSEGLIFQVKATLLNRFKIDIELSDNSEELV